MKNLTLTGRITALALVPLAILAARGPCRAGSKENAPAHDIRPLSATTPERRVQNNVIISEHDPTVEIRLPSSVRYVGADRWVLYDIADCELHAFVETDAERNVQRLFWIQFEGYLPSKPELKHQYDSPQHANIGGIDFYVDTWVQPKGGGTTPGSDSEHIERLIQAKGYKAPPGMMYVRFVHLLDEQKRKELMIIYGEDVASTGHTAVDLRKGGKAYDRWPEIEKGLVERAKTAIALTAPR